MTRQDLGNDNTTLYAEGADLVMERTFDAPRGLVWTALTSADHIPQWLGPRGTTTEIVEWDVRPGGRWCWVNKFEGGDARFAGEYLEVVPPERIVRTSGPDMAEPVGPPAVETITLEELDGKTKVRWLATFPAEEILSFALSTGMTVGMLDETDRLAELLATMG